MTLRAQRITELLLETHLFPHLSLKMQCFNLPIPFFSLPFLSFKTVLRHAILLPWAPKGRIDGGVV